MSNLKLSRGVDVGSQTGLEDQVDALRINPFLTTRTAKEQQVKTVVGLKATPFFCKTTKY